MRINLLIYLLSFIAVAHANSNVVQDPLVLDTVFDEKVDANDPRIKSVMFVSKYNYSSSIEVDYNGFDGKQITKMLTSIFDENGLQYSAVENSKQSSNKVLIKVIQDKDDNGTK